MDYGDIVRLIVFGFIILSFLSGMFGKSDEKKKAERRKPAGQKPRPARPTELAESGGQRPARPPLVPARPMLVGPEQAPPIFDDPGERRIRERERDLLERDTRQTRRVLLERDVRNVDQAGLERDVTDMPSPMDTDPEHHQRARRLAQAARPPRYVEGSDVLRRSLKDPATLERAFIVKEILDRPVGLRNDR